jgi:hypothetical protein
MGKSTLALLLSNLFKLSCFWSSKPIAATFLPLEPKGKKTPKLLKASPMSRMYAFEKSVNQAVER